MDISKLSRLRQVEIPSHCSEDWTAMAGDEKKRFCDGCGCFVHNLSAMEASEAERVLAQTERVCARITVDAKKGILTRDGWIPRMLLAGAVAAAVAGCDSATSVQGDAISSSNTASMGTPSSQTIGKVATPTTETRVIQGDAKVPIKKPQEKTKGQ